MAQVRRRPGERPEVQAWDCYKKEGSDLDTLKRLRGTKPLRQGRCTTLLRQGQYQMLQVDRPELPKPEMRDALRWRVKEMVDFPIDQAGIEVLEIPTVQSGPAARAPQVYVVAASHAVLGPQVRLFQDAKIPLEAIDIPELAQRNVAALFEEDNRGLALLAFDDEGGRLTFTYRGELYVGRRIEASREGLAKADASPGGLYERVLLDVQRSLDNFDRNYSAISLTRLLVTPMPEASSFIDYLKANLYQPVDILDLGQVLDLGEVPALAEPGRQAEALLAIGAALREEAATP